MLKGALIWSKRAQNRAYGKRGTKSVVEARVIVWELGGTALISNVPKVVLMAHTVQLLSLSVPALPATLLVCFDFYKLGDLWSRYHLTGTAVLEQLLLGVSWFSSFITDCL